MVATAAIFAIGVAFAAQPTSLRADSNESSKQQRSLWVPGSTTPMSAHEPSIAVLAPPQ
jgi:hypothetical protein